MGAALSRFPDSSRDAPASGRVLSMVDLYELDDQRSRGDSGLIAGDRVGDATLVAPMRRGAAVTAWSAEGPDGPCAVLVLDKQASGLDRIAFTESARKMADITKDHPIDGVLRVHHVSPDGQAFVADLLSVGSIVDMHALGWHLQRRLALFKTVCQIVGELHLRGVVHGALSPNNVLLDDGLQPVVIDVGFTTSSTQPYAAPEGPGTVRADIYSLGLMLAFVLTGEEPRPIPKDSSPLLQGSADIPHDLLRVVWGCTSKDPSRRYPSVSALIANLPGEMTAFTLAETPDLGQKRPVTAPYHARRRSMMAAEDSLEGAHLGDSFRSYHDGDSRPPIMSLTETGTRAAPDLSRRSIPDLGRRSIPDLGRRSIPDLGRRSIPDLGRKSMVDGLARRAMSPTLVEMDPAWAAGLEWPWVGGGIAAALAAAAMAYFLGDQTATIAFVIGAAAPVAVAVGLPLEKKLHKGAFAAVLLVAGFFLSPLEWVQGFGENARLTSGSADARVKTLTKLANAGRREFPGVSLAGCDLEGIDLSQANLTNSDLGGARLPNSHLAGVLLSGVNLQGTDFMGADLSNADVSQARDFESSLCDAATQMPEDWDCPTGHPIAVEHVVFDPNPVVLSPSKAAN